MLLLLTLACRQDPKPADDTAPPPEETGVPEDTGPVDADGDGSPLADDCDDSDASVFPGAGE